MKNVKKILSVLKIISIKKFSCAQMYVFQKYGHKFEDVYLRNALFQNLGWWKEFPP